MRSFLKYWLPVLAWLGVIFFGSTDIMSAEHTSRFIAPFLRWLKPDISPQTIELVQFVVRKMGHVFEYAVLAMLLWRGVIRGTNLNGKMSILYVSVWIGATLVAVSDEFHQSFVPSRGASWGDVLIDGGGAIFGLLICHRFRRRRNDKSGSQEDRKL